MGGEPRAPAVDMEAVFVRGMRDADPGGWGAPANEDGGVGEDDELEKEEGAGAVDVGPMGLRRAAMKAVPVPVPVPWGDGSAGDVVALSARGAADTLPPVSPSAGEGEGEGEGECEAGDAGKLLLLIVRLSLHAMLTA
ncbi:hypothetical protein OC842_007098 [Tilletia horrida]|uniref:Uncharacterized protein n=1 Tax=Tilletia horrida TaxID=155126 RepID=A0AAN6JMR9_9BASI|nr:hypothetical protein OC842_007098 [Tilletia horrida]